MYTQKELVRPSFFKSMSPGIIPPLAYIVITQKSERLERNRNFFLETTNESKALAASASNVPRTVRATVTIAP